MSVNKIIKEYKKVYNLFKRQGLSRDTVLFTDSKGFSLDRIVPDSISDKFHIVAKSGATASNDEHLKTLFAKLEELKTKDPIILIWFGTCEITTKGKYIYLRNYPYQNIESILTGYRDLRDKILAKFKYVTIILCKQIMESYEERITSLEKTVENKCDEDKVKQIVCEEIKSCNEEMVKIMVKEEVSKIEAPITEEGCDEDKVKAIITEEISKIQKPDNKGDSDSTNNEIDKAAKNITRKETVTNVLEEINERKSRENNLIIFGIPEIDEESKEVRENTDKERLNELFKDCKIQLDKENLKTIKRLGKFNREKLNRPILVKLPSAEPKITLFRNIHYIKTNPKYAKVGVSNMT
ncbi:unnamed protein product [Mytilus edulis]|uniref:Uncharacterized protein n=1 Tax=Mytilus edulis TaxID=6550 RepID=A0A8S3VIX1_MYTED|nr:unnamed protein product [Mytilus edulis]